MQAEPNILYETGASRTVFKKEGLLISCQIVKHNCIRPLLLKERERGTRKEIPAAKWRRKNVG